MKALFYSIVWTLVLSVGASAQYRFQDHHPVYIQGTAPHVFPVHGIDVSRYQGHINWQAVKASGVQFAYLKATEGSDYVDPMYARHLDAAFRAGVRVGAYHFYHFCSSPEAQAALFSRVVERSTGWMPPVVDLEWVHQSSCKRRPSPSQMINEVTRFSQLIERRYGQRPIIYTNKTLYHQAGLAYFQRSHEFWLRSTTANPQLVYPGARWAFWQYTGTGAVPGVNGKVDINAFAGSYEDWAKWLQQRAVRGVPGVW